MSRPVCRACGASLRVINWYPSCKARNNRICKSCLKKRTNLSGYQRSYSRTPNGRYIHAKCKASEKGRPFALSRERYAKLVSMTCTYCEGPLEKAGIGLDQKKAGRGYTVRNSVPCCGWCNTAKSDVFSYEETLVFIGPAVRAIRKQRSKRDDPA